MHLALAGDKKIWASLVPLTLALALLFSMISISLEESFLFLTFVLWAILSLQEKRKFIFPKFFAPLIVYACLTLVSIAFSTNPLASLKDCRELPLFLVVPIVYTAFSKKKELDLTTWALLFSSGATSIAFFYRYIFKRAYPEARITGFIHQGMTQSGLLLLFCALALSLFLFSRGKLRWFWGAGFILASAALALAQIRNAWLGLVVAVLIVLLLLKPAAIPLAAVALGLVFLAGPRVLKDRALSIFSLENASNRERIELVKAGIQIIKDHPLVGTGPRTVSAVFQDPKYGLSAEARKAVHLHNNFIQIAAERGIPACLTWIVFLVWTFLSLAELLKDKKSSVYPLAVGAMAALLAIVTAGIFEYNFGDDEVVILFLYLLILPFSLLRLQREKQNP